MASYKKSLNKKSLNWIQSRGWGLTMPIPIHNFTGNDPDECECATKHESEHVSICLKDKWQCKYALLSDIEGIYCIHPNHKLFHGNALAADFAMRHGRPTDATR